jgi:chemotaxis protein MotB
MRRCSRHSRRLPSPGRTLGPGLAALLLLLGTACVTRGTYQEVVDQRDGLRAEKHRLEERVRRLEASSQSLDAERVQLIDEMEDMRQDREQLQTDLRRLHKAEAELSRNLAAREAELASTSAEVQRLRGTYEGLVSDLQAELAQGQIEIRQLREGLQLNMAQEVLFASGSAEVNRGGRALLTKVAERVRGVPYQVVVQGHTDNVPIRRGRYPSNWELAGARASHVVRYLASQGVPPERLSAVSFGEYAPRASNDTAEGRARNRRIEITLKPIEGEEVVVSPLDAEKPGSGAAGPDSGVPAAVAP